MSVVIVTYMVKLKYCIYIKLNDYCEAIKCILLQFMRISNHLCANEYSPYIEHITVMSVHMNFLYFYSGNVYFTFSTWNNYWCTCRLRELWPNFFFHFNKHCLLVYQIVLKLLLKSSIVIKISTKKIQLQ